VPVDCLKGVSDNCNKLEGPRNIFANTHRILSRTFKFTCDPLSIADMAPRNGGGVILSVYSQAQITMGRNCFDEKPR
jgi:hypothetical protein